MTRMTGPDCVVMCNLINTHTHTHTHTHTVRRGRGGKEKEWTDCVQSDIRAFGITGDWKTMALKAEVWVEAVTERRHRQEKREATRLGKLQLHTEA